MLGDVFGPNGYPGLYMIDTSGNEFLPCEGKSFGYITWDATYTTNCQGRTVSYIWIEASIQTKAGTKIKIRKWNI